MAGPGGTILMGSQIWVNGEKTVENVTIARAEGYEGTMLSVSSGAALTVRNAVIDGKNGGGTGRYLLTVNRNATVNLETGAVLQNNAGTAVSVTEGTLNMKGGVRNNKARRTAAQSTVEYQRSFPAASSRATKRIAAAAAFAPWVSATSRFPARRYATIPAYGMAAVYTWRPLAAAMLSLP
ncbi:MAG: hypothetical protein ACLUVV_06140 [Christensenellales bacterium]